MINQSHEILAKKFKDLAPPVEYCRIRLVEKIEETLTLRQNILEPPNKRQTLGAMVEIYHQGGYGFSATCELHPEGIKESFDRANTWAKHSKNRTILPKNISFPFAKGSYKGPCLRPWNEVSMNEKRHLLEEASARSQPSSRIVDRFFSFTNIKNETLMICLDGSEVWQEMEITIPRIAISANKDFHTETRTFHGHGFCRQGGFEIIETISLPDKAAFLAEDALLLLAAPNCPEASMEVLIAPDQMILQIHESIGHPLEIDRILGDERNYAGGSFVVPEMFGKFQYGSDILNVTFSPDHVGELASYRYDDEGMQAGKYHLIKNGILQRGLGGYLSQRRSGIQGVANARAENWNRPPIDRMANINLEPGTSTLTEMISSIENGILLETNCSWSIDDMRNKFQFGCEKGTLIRNGELKEVVRKPNYRGLSVNFWKSLKMVGNESTLATLGTPYCGKGEPNQAITVGHSSPTCLFEDVSVFGGAQ